MKQNKRVALKPFLGPGALEAAGSKNKLQMPVVPGPGGKARREGAQRFGKEAGKEDRVRMERGGVLEALTPGRAVWTEG